MEKNYKFLDLANLKVIWSIISNKFAKKDDVKLLERRIEFLEDTIKKISS